MSYCEHPSLYLIPISIQVCPLHHLQELALIIIHNLWSMLAIANKHLLIIIKERHYTDEGGPEGELGRISAPQLKHIYI